MFVEDFLVIYQIKDFMKMLDSDPCIKRACRDFAGRLIAYRQPESRNVYFCMGAKNAVQPAMPIRPGFAQLA